MHNSNIPKVNKNEDSNNSKVNHVIEFNKLVDESDATEKSLKSQYHYKKRTGTSGIRGQLYETKLLSLFLLRLLKDKNVTDFQLGTNVDGIGAFDDIVIKYKLKGLERPKIVFIQTKHRDDPVKNKLTIEELLQDKYLGSYRRIKDKFIPDNEDDIFCGTFKDVDCSFVFFTPALENLEYKKVFSDASTKYLLTGATEHLFQYDYKEDDIKNLKTLLLSRIELLAKTFITFALKENNNMMLNDLIKTYHVYLANNVLDISSTTERELQGKFSKSFFESNNEFIRHFRLIVYHELISKYTESINNVEIFAKNLSFKLPYNFGNLNFCLNGTDKNKKRKINYICLKLKQLLDISDSLNVIKINDDMVRNGQILKDTDLKQYRIGGLVGNLFIFDENTDMLKFNNNEKPICEDAMKIFDQLKTHSPNIKDFNKYRLDIDCDSFPQVTLRITYSDIKIIKGYLNNLKLYTQQAQEDKVEEILKNEINLYYNVSKKKESSLYHIKTEALFSKVHNKVQDWWKLSIESPYLNKNSNYYEDTKEEIFNSSLLSILNYFCLKNIDNANINFKDIAMKPFIISYLDTLLKQNIILNITTRDIIITSVKLRECLFQNNRSSVFLDLQSIVLKYSFEATLNEIKNSDIQLLVILCQSCDLLEKLTSILKSISIATIVITDLALDVQLTKRNIFRDVLQITDDMTAFNNLTTESQNKFLEKNIVTFQGVEIILGKIINKNLYHVLNADVFRTIINKENIDIGKPLKTAKYNEIKDSYIEQNISRCIKLKINESLETEFNIFTDEVMGNSPKENSDIVLISDNKQEFDKLCEKYSEYNIHWFTKNGIYNEWKKTYGKLNRLSDYVEVCRLNKMSRKPITFLDIKERIVVLSAEPGMGKSTLMTYSSVQMKTMNPELWIIKIDFNSYNKLFSKWQDDEINIDLKEVMKFVFTTSSAHINDQIHEAFDINVNENGEISVALKEKSIGSLFLLEIELFCACYNNGRIAMLFDGFDEISPEYTKEVIRMMEVLKQSNIYRLFITSRSYNILNQLQNALGTFSYKLSSLSVPEQINFLEKFWAESSGKIITSNFSYRVYWFHKLISVGINDTDNKFTSIPLNLYMISEIYQDLFSRSFNIYCLEKSYELSLDFIAASNLITFFELFVEKKFRDIRFGSKKRDACLKDADMKKLIRKERKDFIDSHKMLAAYTLFHKNVEGLFYDEGITKMYEIIETIKVGEEKTGIVEQVVANEPKFVHLAYAEYFATEYLCDKLKSKNCPPSIWVYLFSTVLPNFPNLRKFLECKFQKDQQFFDLSLNTTHKHVFNTSLYTAVKEFSNYTALFILNCIRVVTTKDNLDKFINYVRKKYYTNNINLLKCSDTSGYNALLASLCDELNSTSLCEISGQ